jgi:tetratricopeptide (TPR) repeat protein
VSALLAAALTLALLVWDPRAPAADPKRALGLLVAVAVLAASFARGHGPRPPRAALAFAAFVVWSALGLLWGVPAGVRDLGTWVAAAGLALALPPGEARRLAGAVAALGGSGAAIVAIAQRLGGARGIHVHGGQGNANWLGLFLALALPLTLGLLRERWRFALVAASIQAVGLVLSHSRVAWAAALISLGALLWLRGGVARRWRALAVAAALAAGAAATIVPAASSPEAAPVEGEDVPVPVALRGRSWIWRCSFDAALSSLPAGAGLGGFGHAYLDAQGGRLAELEPKAASRRFLNATTAHQDWLETLVDGGPIAPALLLVALLLGARAARRDDWAEGAVALFAFALCAAGDSPLRQPAVALLLGPTLAGAAEPAPRLPRRVLAGAALAACAALLAISVGGLLASRALTAAKEATPEARGALLARAARLDPRSGEIAVDQGLLALAEGDPEAALGALQRSRVLLANVGTDVAIGNAEVLLGRPERAVRAYEAALRRHPGSFRAHVNLIEPLLSLGRIDEAERHRAVAVKLWPGHPRLAEMSDRLQRARVDRATER